MYLYTQVRVRVVGWGRVEGRARVEVMVRVEGVGGASYE